MFKKLRQWWNRDRAEIGKEEASMTPAERDVAEEDFESRKDDVEVRGEFASGAGARGIDFERDSEPPGR